MRRALVALVCLAVGLAACRKEPSFDERYDTARKTIDEMADGIDQDLARENTATPHGGETNAAKAPKTKHGTDAS